MNVLVLEPWMGGSHRRFLDQWCARSRHAVAVLGLAPRHWKWRMSAAHWELARRIRSEERPAPDVLVASDYVDLPGLFGLLSAEWAAVPAVLYFHESQLTYPVRSVPGAPAPAPDHSFGFVNVLSCLRAEAVAFNTRYHLDELRGAAEVLMAALPRPNPRAELAAALDSAEIVYPGIDLSEVALGPGPELAAAPLRVVFSHRWEHDKDPLACLRAVAAVRRAGCPLELSLLGETFASIPAGCEPLLAELEDAIVCRGFLPSRAAYVQELGRADVVVSTARHEFYGISVLEAVAAGCHPLLPRALSYPEVVPGERHAAALYDDHGELVERLTALGRRTGELRLPAARAAWRSAVTAHDADRTASQMDALCERLARPPRTRGASLLP